MPNPTPAAVLLADCRPLPSPFARLEAWQARAVLVVLILAIVAGIGVTLSPIRQGFADAADRGPGDGALYRAEVDRVARGESYYAAANAELRARGYPTASVFNWRTPLPVWLLGVTGITFGKVLLGGLCLGLLLAAFEWSARESGPGVAVLTSVCLLGALLPCLLGDLVVMPVLWAGVLIALSVVLLGLNQTTIGVVAGVTALFVRDLAGPFCLGAMLLALWRRRFAEAAGWAAGLVAYAAFFAWHIWQLQAFQSPGDVAHAESWIQLAGAPFVLAAAQMNAVLLLLPQGATAVYLPLALLGFASWNSPGGVRAGLAAVGFVLMFALMGQEFNQYWGALFAPLLCLGIGRVPLALRDLWNAAHPRVAPASAGVGFAD